jgi:hypothetical protein
MLLSFPLDGLDDGYLYLIVQPTHTVSHYIQGGRAGELLEGSGAYFAEKLAEHSIPGHEMIKLGFLVKSSIMTKKQLKNLSPAGLRYSDDSDGAACALAYAGYHSNIFKFKSKSPIILVSCSIAQSGYEQGYHGLKLKRVIDERTLVSRKATENLNVQSLQNKWKASIVASAKHGGALVLHEEDADILARKEKLTPIQCKDLGECIRSNGFIAGKPFLVTVSDREMPGLATVFGISPEIFEKLKSGIFFREPVNDIQQKQKNIQILRDSLKPEYESLDILGRKQLMATHYQMLPILQQLRTRDLPISQIKEADHEYSLQDIASWENNIQQRFGHSKPYNISQPRNIFEVLQNFSQVICNTSLKVPRFILLGPPGSGKSTLLRYLAWSCLEEKLFPDHRYIPIVIDHLRAWETWANQHSDYSLATYLANLFKDRLEDNNPTLWLTWLKNGDIFLLLDGLNEINPFFVKKIEENLAIISCPMVMTCRTISFEEYKSLENDMPVFTLSKFERETYEAYIQNFPRENSDNYQSESLIEYLENI